MSAISIVPIVNPDGCEESEKLSCEVNLIMEKSYYEIDCEICPILYHSGIGISQKQIIGAIVDYLRDEKIKATTIEIKRISRPTFSSDQRYFQIIEFESEVITDNYKMVQ